MKFFFLVCFIVISHSCKENHEEKVHVPLETKVDSINPTSNTIGVKSDSITHDLNKIENDTITSTPNIEAKKFEKDNKGKAIELSSHYKKEKSQNPNANQKVSNAAKAIITFDDKTFYYDTIIEGDVVKHKFKFTNTGQADLNILKADVSCGCTVPTYPFLEIAPGGNGEIGAEFHSVNKEEGLNESTITVFTDAANHKVELKLKGYIKAKNK